MREMPGSADSMTLAGVELPKPLADALRSCWPHVAATAAFSLLVNILFRAPPLYMLQVYDRVVATGGKTTLLFITLALTIALLTLAAGRTRPPFRLSPAGTQPVRRQHQGQHLPFRALVRR